SMSPLPKSAMSGASGFLNLTRQLGGSIGIALITTFLDGRNTFHRQVLVEKLTPSSPLVQQRLAQFTGGMIARGSDPVTAARRALAFLDGTVRRQAAVLSFGDTFWVVAVAFIVTLPLLLLLGSGKGAKAGAAH